MQNRGLIIGISIIVVILLILGSFLGMYNRLQVLDETVNSNWAQIENQLKRRNDLIPNLVNTVKGYAAHEKGVFSEVAQARAKLAGAVGSKNIKDVTAANNQFNSALSRLLAIAENYPQLQANRNFIALQDELAGTENRIAVARKDYNDSVKTINATIRTFPSNIIASFSEIKARDYFEVSETEKATPEVKF